MNKDRPCFIITTLRVRAHQNEISHGQVVLILVPNILFSPREPPGWTLNCYQPGLPCRAFRNINKRTRRPVFSRESREHEERAANGMLFEESYYRRLELSRGTGELCFINKKIFRNKRSSQFFEFTANRKMHIHCSYKTGNLPELLPAKVLAKKTNRRWHANCWQLRFSKNTMLRPFLGY